MIDPRELRIGNILQSRDKDGDGSIITVKEFDLVGVNQFVSQAGYEHEYLYEKTDYYDWYWVEPILLTSEWMERMGFEKKNFDRWGDGWAIHIMASANRYLGICNLTPRTLTTVVCENDRLIPLDLIRYVHQAQNIYNALTGKELTIKSFNQSN